MKQVMRNGFFSATFDRDFQSVIEHCASVRRRKSESTWISDEFIDAYSKFHAEGYAHSVEVWHDKKLVGGLYGVSMGKCFFGESMFSLMSNASKFGFIFLVEQLKQWDFQLVDCQIFNPHLATLGAKNIPRKEFLFLLTQGLKSRTKKGDWGM
jgi:leucyl/phenylalanyl-tRNA--protein transferase